MILNTPPKVSRSQNKKEKLEEGPLAKVGKKGERKKERSDISNSQRLSTPIHRSVKRSFNDSLINQSIKFLALLVTHLVKTPRRAYFLLTEKE